MKEDVLSVLCQKARMVCERDLCLMKNTKVRKFVRQSFHPLGFSCCYIKVNSTLLYIEKKLYKKKFDQFFVHFIKLTFSYQCFMKFVFL